MLAVVAGDSLIEEEEFTSAMGQLRVNGIPDRFYELDVFELIDETRSVLASCNDKSGSPEITTKLLEFTNYMLSGPIELERLDKKSRELFSTEQLNSCEVKYQLFLMYVSTMASTGVEVQLPEGIISSPAENRTIVHIQVKEGSPQFFINDLPFPYIDLDTKTIDLEKMRETIAGTTGGDVTIELKASEDVSYAWPAQVIDLARQNKWKIVLVYQQD